MRLGKGSALIQHRDPPQEQTTRRKQSKGHNNDNNFITSGETHERKGHKEAEHSITGSDEQSKSGQSEKEDYSTPTWARRKVRRTSQQEFPIHRFQTWRCYGSTVQVRDEQTSKTVSGQFWMISQSSGKCRRTLNDVLCSLTKSKPKIIVPTLFTIER